MSLFAENSRMMGAEDASDRFTFQSTTPSPVSFYSTPFPASKPPFLTILTSILSQFFLSKTPTAEIDDRLLARGTFLTPLFIQRVVGTGTSSPTQLINMSEAHAKQRIEERTQMLGFILQLMGSGRREKYSVKEIQGLCWLNGYVTVDEEFVREFVTNEWINK